MNCNQIECWNVIEKVSTGLRESRIFDSKLEKTISNQGIIKRSHL